MWQPGIQGITASTYPRRLCHGQDGYSGRGGQEAIKVSIQIMAAVAKSRGYQGYRGTIGTADMNYELK